MKKHMLQGAGLMLSMSFATFTAHADSPIIFDPTGSGSTSTTIGGLDWAVNSAIIVPNAGSTITSGDSQVYVQASLADLIPTSGSEYSPTGLNTSYQITMVGAFEESVTPAPGDPFTSIQQGIVGGTNFFEIFATPSGTPANPLTGLGYSAGTLILAGSITEGTVIGNFTDNTAINSSAFPITALDDFNPSNYVGYTTIQGSGSTSLAVNISFVDPSYFPDTDLSTLLLDLNFTSNEALPFNEVDPSANFTTASGGTTQTFLGTGDPINAGCVNGGVGTGVCSDLILQTDASSSFVATTPEPASLALLGVGLVGLGAARGWRRSRKGV